MILDNASPDTAEGSKKIGQETVTGEVISSFEAVKMYQLAFRNLWNITNKAETLERQDRRYRYALEQLFKVRQLHFEVMFSKHVAP